VLNVVDPVAWTVADPHLGDALAHRLDIAGVAEAQAADARLDPRLGSSVAKIGQPLVENRRLDDLDQVATIVVAQPGVNFGCQVLKYRIAGVEGRRAFPPC
jgi:hypothetical protein